MTRPLVAAVMMLAAFSAAPLAAQQPALDRHFLSQDEFFIAPESLSSGITWVAVARQIIGPTAPGHGESQFLIVAPGAGYEVGQFAWTRYYWRSRAAATNEIALGARVFCFSRSEDDVYRAPRNRDDALNEGWWSALVSDLSDLSRQEVRAGGHRLSLDCLRVEDATASDAVPPALPEPAPPPSPTAAPAAAPPAAAPAAAAAAAAPPAAAATALDRHFLTPAEYFIAPGERSWTWDRVAVARLVTAPTAATHGRAQFVVVGKGAGYEVGDRVWTTYFWQSRAATPQDAVVGKRVFCLSESVNQVYRGPRDRNEALNSGWWTLTITDVARLQQEEVQSGIYRLGLNCMRVER